MKEKDNVLLDRIFEFTDLEVLSDLKYLQFRPQIREALHKLHVTDYSLAQWIYALSYIMGRSMEITTEKDLYEILEQL